MQRYVLNGLDKVIQWLLTKLDKMNERRNRSGLVGQLGFEPRTTPVMSRALWPD